MEKPKPKVTPIVVPDDKLQFLKKKLGNPDLALDIKRDLVKEIIRGKLAGLVEGLCDVLLDRATIYRPLRSHT